MLRKLLAMQLNCLNVILFHETIPLKHINRSYIVLLLSTNKSILFYDIVAYNKHYFYLLSGS
jgi:hypothetical protein